LSRIVALPIAIVGAGISGACLAWRLAARGLPVVLFDDARTGRATAWNPGGINPLHGPGFPGPMAPVYGEAYRLHCERRVEVEALSGIGFGWQVIDRLFLAQDVDEAGALRRMADHYAAMPGFSARWMEPDELARWDRRIGPHWAGGLMTNGNVRLDTERYRQALVAAAIRRGARLVAARVEAVGSRGDRAVSIRGGGETIEIAGICMATGAWADDPIAGWSPGGTLPVRPLIGDLLMVEAEDGPAADVGRGLVAIYQHDGRHYWVGGTEREDGPLGPIDPAMRERLIEGIGRLMPGWRSWRVVGEGSAARPVTPDRLPVVGRTPACANGWTINGGGGKGILLSAWLAETLTRMIETGEEPAEAAPFAPARSVC
jgi:glycine/D-amino acid oxidase-like deaminating enzyme